MKFSYKLLGQFVGGLPKIEKAADWLTLHLFETKVIGKNVLEVEILPNRYSDAASYLGLAREMAAITDKKLNNLKFARFKKYQQVKVKVETKACRRLMACYFDGIKIGPSPRWLIEALLSSGQQPINNLVDVTNYVTLETGQPLHAFDFDKLAGSVLFVRQAKRGERVTTLENKTYQLEPSMVVLADAQGPLDIAGIKGGRRAEITNATRKILLTAGNFTGPDIYRTAKEIGLVTDAASRFSHDISPALVDWGMGRATLLIKQLCGGRGRGGVDKYLEKPPRRLLKFHFDKFEKLTGLSLKKSQIIAYLKKLGFGLKGNLVEAPAERTDIEIFEDLVEEVVRLVGYNNLPVQAPVVSLKPAGAEEQLILKDNLRRALVSFGWDEVYNYSFVPSDSAKEAVALANPISRSLALLRPSLLINLAVNLDDNRRFFKEVRIFEIGKVFNPAEKLMLGLAIATGQRGAFFELKGAVEQLFEWLGLVDYSFREETEARLAIESDHQRLGSLMHQAGDQAALAEIDLDKLLILVEEEKSFEPLAKYPTVMRDLSLLVTPAVRFSEILSLIQKAAPRYLNDVDLIDSYEDEKFAGRRGLTIRLVFLAPDRTLTDKEVGLAVKKISTALVDNLDIEIR